MVVLAILDSTGIDGRGKHYNSFWLRRFLFNVVVDDGALAATIAVTASKNWCFFLGFSFLSVFFLGLLTTVAVMTWYGSRYGDRVGSRVDCCCIEL